MRDGGRRCRRRWKGENGGEEGGREGEGASEEGRKVYCTREGERERVLVIFSGTCMYVRKSSSSQRLH